jgi:hypothetical protein
MPQNFIKEATERNSSSQGSLAYTEACTELGDLMM